MTSKLAGTVVLADAVKYLMMVDASGKQNELVLGKDGALIYAVDGKWQGMGVTGSVAVAKYDAAKAAAQSRGVEVTEVVC